MTREEFIKNVTAEQEGLRRFLLALCEGDRAQADDLAQSALVKAYVASADYIPRVKFSTWLYRIAYNCFIDYVRKKRPKTIDEASSEAQNLADDSRADSRFEHQDLYAAIEKLPPKEKAVILLFYMEDRPIKEISTILSIPEGTIKSHLSRGREHLKTLMNNERRS